MANFDIKSELINIILNNSNLNSTFTIIHPNTKFSLSSLIDEILYVLKSGVSWRNLRSPIPFKTVFYHFNCFSKERIFHKLFSKLKTIYLKSQKPHTFLVDSTSIYNKFGVNKIGRNKFYKNKRITKISLLSDINGFPLSVFFMKGNKHDISVFTKHVDDLLIIVPKRNKKILADKGYSSKFNYDYLNSLNISHIIPPRINMKIYDSYLFDKSEYIKRIKIEHIFGRLKLFNRINNRFEKKTS
jgi:transposase